MADKSSIEWTDATWNPTVGCSIVSPGCTNCYAMKMAARCEAMGTAHYAGTTRKVKSHTVWTGLINAAPDHILTQPLRWKRPRRIFVNSMSDLFAEGVPDEVIDKVFAVMALCPQHTFQVLTKRPERMRDYLKSATLAQFAGSCVPGTFPISKADIRRAFGMCSKFTYDPPTPVLPLPNVWLGVSVEDQTRADERIPILLQTSAAVRFISAEPLLGPVDLTSLDPHGNFRPYGANGWSAIWRNNHIGRNWLDWVIVGGESGPGARPMHPDWARQIRDDCAAAGVPFFFKQWGNWAPGECCGPQRRTQVGAWFDSVPDAAGGKWDRQIVTAATGACFTSDDEPDVWEVGKHTAGRLLDGVTHDGMPG